MKPTPQMSRRSLLAGAGVSAAALGAAPAATAARRTPRAARHMLPGVLGVDTDDHLPRITTEMVERTGVTWVRGIIPVKQMDLHPVPTGWRSFVAATPNSRRICSLRMWLEEIPRPGTPEFDVHWGRFEGVLEAIRSEVDVVVVGNEPFVEVRHRTPGWIGRMIDYYDAMAHRTLRWRDRRRPHLLVYLGAVNRVGAHGNVHWTHRDVTDYLRILRRHPRLAGVDLHPHVSLVDQIKPFVTTATAALAPHQRLLATEFTLQHRWENWVGGEQPARLSPAFTRRHPRKPQPEYVHQYLDEVLGEHKASQAEWDDFYRMHPVLSRSSSFVTEAMRVLRSSGRLHVATYGGISQTVADDTFRLGDHPWLLSAVFATDAVRHREDGRLPVTRCWYDAVRRQRH